MKKRPVLTVLAADDGDDDAGLGLLRPPKPTIRPVLRLDSKGGDDDDDNVADDDEDALETSCDIGETTLKKGPIHINRSGVTFVEADEKGGDDEAKRPSPGRPASGGMAPSPPPSRRQIPLDMLETCGLIGRGCSGHVMKARHRDTGGLYALKVVNNVYDKAKRDQMLTEIRTLYSVESPWLVDFYGAYFRDHQLSLVLEFCAAGSLDGLIQRRGPIPEPIVACMAHQMLLGLAHLKRTHHFHRDIKPQNILVQDTGAVKLTDFGIARELGHSQDMAQTFVGTFKYMSPERVQNEPYAYQSDIWSLGLVLIECATKLFPFRNARSYIDVVQSIIECAEPELPANTGELAFTDDFRRFLSDCLKKDPRKRASVEQLLISPWFARHRATDGQRCARRVMRWLNGDGDDDGGDDGTDAKGRRKDDDDGEIDEEIVEDYSGETYEEYDAKDDEE